MHTLEERKITIALTDGQEKPYLPMVFGYAFKTIDKKNYEIITMKMYMTDTYGLLELCGGVLPTTLILKLAAQMV